MGPVLRADAFNAEIESIKKEANDAYTGKGGTPDYMQVFLREMEVSANRARQEIALGVREQGEILREETLLELGDAIYGEVCARTSRELFKALSEVQDKMAHAWQELNSRRAKHEKLLAPRLSNPNAEQELQNLIEEEANRYKAALMQLREDRKEVVTCFRQRANLFVTRLASASDAAFHLVDALPLFRHFAALPGDEQVEPARMSIKRRMRRFQKGEGVDQNPEHLPKRSWEASGVMSSERPCEVANGRRILNLEMLHLRCLLSSPQAFHLSVQQPTRSFSSVGISITIASRQNFFMKSRIDLWSCPPGKIKSRWGRRIGYRW